MAAGHDPCSVPTEHHAETRARMHTSTQPQAEQDITLQTVSGCPKTIVLVFSTSSAAAAIAVIQKGVPFATASVAEEKDPTGLSCGPNVCTNTPLAIPFVSSQYGLKGFE